MCHRLNVIFSILICFLVSGNVSAQEAKLKITRLAGDFYIYTTYSEYKGSRIGANGMYVITREGVIIIDSPWDTTQFQPLLDSIQVKHNKTAVMCIATHFHEDRSGGLEYYRKLGIKTYTTRQTDALSKQHGMKRAEFLIDKDTLFTFGQYTFKTIYPGKGHAPDNIVIWFEKEKILYGGCLIKSVEDETLGYLGDASINDYPTTIRNVQAKCKNPAYVIPGHNDWNNPTSVTHTLQMAEQLKVKNRQK
jgi:metallo-beta-lactamase class B